MSTNSQDNWYFLRGSEQIGPLHFDKLREHAAKGDFGPNDLVWSPDLPEWTKASAVSGLIALQPPPRPAAPPPAPPARPAPPPRMASAAEPPVRRAPGAAAAPPMRTPAPRTPRPGNPQAQFAVQPSGIPFDSPLLAVALCMLFGAGWVIYDIYLTSTFLVNFSSRIAPQWVLFSQIVLAARGLFLLLLGLTAFFFFSRKQAFPTLFIILLCVGIAIYLVPAIYSYAMTGRFASVTFYLRTVVAIALAAFFIPYTLTAQIVKTTFVNR